MPSLLNNIIVFQKAVIRNSNGKILALRRRKDDVRRPGAWDLPGGGFEKGEDLENALRREILEETGLVAQKMKILRAQSVFGINDIPDADNIYLGWEILSWHGEVQISEEHSEFRWVTPAEFAKLKTWDEQGFLQNTVVDLISK